MSFPLFLDWQREHRDDYDVILFDIDGTLIHGKHELPGARKLLQQLRNEGVPFMLLTNDANHSCVEKAGILGRRGIEVCPEEIISAGQILTAYAEQEGLIGEKVFVLGDLGKPCFAELAGLTVTRDPDDLSDIAAVLVGEGDYDWQNHITAALNAIRNNPSIRLISPNPDTCWPTNGNQIGIGAGAVARMISNLLVDNGLSIKPIYFGKPHRAVFEYALTEVRRRFGAQIPPSRVLMLGDNLFSDIRGARAAGFTAGLVLTGMTHLAMLEDLRSEYQPDFIFNAITEETDG